MKLTAFACALAAAFAIAAPGLAAQVQPLKPVPTTAYTGRWYEIARTPNGMQADCQGSTTDFAGWAAGKFLAVQTCHKGVAAGPKATTSVHGKVLAGSMNAKMQLAMLGGLITQQYWIVDHAADNGWLIMATPNARYVWLMSRQPVLSAAVRAQALGRIQQLGFDLTRLAFPQQLTH
jgi:apolipoprotein D and lipocalin family protein